MRLAAVLITLVLLAGIVAAYFYSQLTAVVAFADSNIIQKITVQEAQRKFKLFEDARTNNRKGYVRLTEAEINAYMDEFLASDNAVAPTNLLHSVQLVKSRIYLKSGGFTWVCWVKASWRWWRCNLVWLRDYDLVYDRGRWDLHLLSMFVGKQRLQPWSWIYADRLLGEVDQPFAGKHQWLTELPAMEIRTNELSLKLEFKLYNYPDTNVLREASK